MKNLRFVTRIVLALAVLSMISGYYLPLWEIQLWAPQYPEGLNMKIWLNHLSGDFDIINGLNHYIGMKHIKEEMFPEFQFMGYVLGFLIVAGLVPVFSGKRRMLVVYVAILFIAGGLGIFDFWRWGHDYGHNLDPKAAISVPGMTYDPPIIGYKSLLNFVAYSGPGKGGWILLGSGGIATALLLWELLLSRKRSKRQSDALNVLAVLPILLILPGCDAQPQAIEYGRDNCAGCTMTLVDKHYGSEFVSGKGKVYKFDDVNCLVEFLGRDPATSDKSSKTLIVDFNQPGVFLKAGKAVFLKHRKLRTPMGSHIGAFAFKDAAEAVDKELGGGGEFLTWVEVLNQP